MEAIADAWLTAIWGAIAWAALASAATGGLLIGLAYTVRAHRQRRRALAAQPERLSV